MQGYDGGNGLQIVEGGGGVNHLVGDAEVALGGDGDDLAVAALDSLHAGNGFLLCGVASHQAVDGEVFLDLSAGILAVPVAATVVPLHDLRNLVGLGPMPLGRSQLR